MLIVSQSNRQCVCRKRLNFLVCHKGQGWAQPTCLEIPLLVWRFPLMSGDPPSLQRLSNNKNSKKFPEVAKCGIFCPGVPRCISHPMSPCDYAPDKGKHSCCIAESKIERFSSCFFSFLEEIRCSLIAAMWQKQGNKNTMLNLAAEVTKLGLPFFSFEGQICLINTWPFHRDAACVQSGRRA